MLRRVPPDHGESFQVCCRIIWEVGHPPVLRVKFLWAVDPIAAERSLLIRDAIANNEWVRAIFPNLKPADPWAACGFTLNRYDCTTTLSPALHRDAW